MVQYYKDNPHNRRLGRVGLPYSGGKETAGVNFDTKAISEDETVTFTEYPVRATNRSNNNSVAEQPVDVRMGFIRKVYAILTLQLATMVAVAGCMVAIEEVTVFVQTNPGILMLALIGSIVSMIALAFKQKDVPVNFVLLAIFTLLESYTVGVVVTLYTVESVVQCLAITLALFVGLTIFAMQSRWDFTSLAGPLAMGIWFLVISYIVMMFFPMPAFEFGLTVFAAILFCALVVVDTQMIMSKVSEEDYISAVVMLYLDVVNLFLQILRLFGDRR